MRVNFDLSLVTFVAANRQGRFTHRYRSGETQSDGSPAAVGTDQAECGRLGRSKLSGGPAANLQPAAQPSLAHSEGTLCCRSKSDLRAFLGLLRPRRPHSGASGLTPTRAENSSRGVLKFLGAVVAFWLLHLTALAQAPAPGISPLPTLPVFVVTNAFVHQTNSYVIVPNDMIWLKVYQEEDLETKAKVNKDGLITVPLLGTVAISGKSVDQAQEMIREMLDRRFVINPQVSLVVTEYSKRRFTILGQVGRPGIYEYSGDEKLTVLNAIALAGGFTRLAAPSKVTIQRMELGLPRSYRIHAEAVMKDPKAGPFQVQPEDTITVGSKLF